MTAPAMEAVLCARITSMTDMLAILAIMAGWGDPGLNTDPQVPANTAAPAMAG